MLFALTIADVLFSDTSLRAIMPNATGKSGDRPAPTLVPLSHRHSGGVGGSAKRSSSSSSVAVHPEHVGAAESFGSTCAAAEKVNTPPPQQSMPPRATSSPFRSVTRTLDEEEDEAAVADVPSLPSAAATASPAAGVMVAEATDGGALNRNGSSNSSAVGANSGAPTATGAGGIKTPKRAQKKITSGVHLHRRTNNSSNNNSGSSGGSGSGGVGGAASRSASELCRAARTLAAELMSALMEHPPQAAQIAQYRQSLQSSPALTPHPAPGGVAASADTAASHDPLAQEGATQKSSAAHTTEFSGAAAAASSSHSFLEAVRNGRAKLSHAASPSTSAVAPTSPPVLNKAGSGTPVLAPAATGNAGSRRRSASPTVALSPPTSSGGGGSAAGSSGRRQPLELMPEDAAAIPQLLSLLREIALSCASLGTLNGRVPPSTANASTAPLAASASSNNSSNKGIDSGGSGGGAAAAAVTATTDEAATHPSCSPLHEAEIDYYEEQWQRVRMHLQLVRGLLLNGHEFADALDAALGADWRTAATATTATPPAELAETKRDDGLSSQLAPLPAPSTEDVVRAAVEAAMNDSVVPVMPTPVGQDGPLQSTAKAAAVTGSGRAGTVTVSSTNTTNVTTTAASKSTNTGTDSASATTTATSTTTFTTTTTTFTTTTTTLNHNARPFHSRTPPSFPPPTVTQADPSSTPATGASPPANAAAAGRGTSGGTTNATNTTPRASNNSSSNAASSMKQLSENSSTYSPSPHVTTFLERSTPPASGRLVDDAEGGGLMNFPSTPLSEAAAPYQPTMSLVGGTSPRGGNASTSSSVPFHLESREEMLRRRSAAPNAFYASMTHGGATHYLGGPPSAATTPGTFVPSSVPPGSPPFALPSSGARSMPVSPLLTYGSPVAASVCPYDYILVLDFEATCEEHPPPNYLYEIIEFPVVVVDVRLQRVVAEFHRFVRPHHKVELSHFCRELTGMRQADVDAAAPLEEVILQFERWFAHTVPLHARCVFATDGPMDMREFMYHHSVSRQGIRFPALFYQYIDVKQTFACFFQCSQGKIKAMLEVLHVPFEGRLHSGLDDARNIAAIVVGLLQYGCTFCEVPLNRLPLNGLLLSSGAAAAAGSGSTPLSLPPSTAAEGSGRHRSTAASPTYKTAPYSVDEDESSY